MARTATTLGGSIASFIDASPSVAARGQKLVSNVQAACLAKGATIAASFPGACSASADAPSFASCVVARSRCRLCQSLDGAQGLGIGCDLFDDGTANTSCP